MRISMAALDTRAAKLRETFTAEMQRLEKELAAKREELAKLVRKKGVEGAGGSGTGGGKRRF